MAQMPKWAAKVEAGLEQWPTSLWPSRVSMAPLVLQIMSNGMKLYGSIVAWKASKSVNASLADSLPVTPFLNALNMVVFLRVSRGGRVSSSGSGAAGSCLPPPRCKRKLKARTRHAEVLSECAQPLFTANLISRRGVGHAKKYEN